MENQTQNIVTAREDAARRIDMPIEPDQVDNKIVDPKDRRQRREERRKKRDSDDREGKPVNRDDSAGRFVDLSA